MDATHGKCLTPCFWVWMFRVKGKRTLPASKIQPKTVIPQTIHSQQRLRIGRLVFIDSIHIIRELFKDRGGRNFDARVRTGLSAAQI